MQDKPNGTLRDPTEVVVLSPQWLTEETETSTEEGRERAYQPFHTISIADMNEPRNRSTVQRWSGQDYIPMRSLYTRLQSIDPNLSPALAILEEAVPITSQILTSVKAGGIQEADDALIRVQQMYLQLFSYRKLGLGFANIVSSVFNAIANLVVTPISRQQAIEISYVTKILRADPLLTFEKSMEYLAPLSSCGLELEPQDLASIIQNTFADDASENSGA